MKEIRADERKAIQIDILAAADEYCEANHLTYFMSYGTLLGAVRHKGFIPWDDDIDIAMPYPDFQKFCLGFRSERFKVNYWKKQSEFYCNYAKLEDVRTLAVEDIVQKYIIGINIDIAPIIGLPADLAKARDYYKRIVLYRNLLTLKKTRFRKGRSVIKQAGLFLSRILLFFVSNRWINHRIDEMCGRYPYDKSKYVICVGSFNPVREIIEKDQLGLPIRLPFENRSFSAPSGYDAWLKQKFGDYMQLPPEEKRVSHHTFRMFWREGYGPA